ncbi:endoribonuclease YicC domain-containing protein, partial [Gemmatimonas sp.]
DESRLAQEIAILADRMDVAEELDRFRSHLVAFRAALNDSGGEPVGKRLGFLLQEMLRETNTTGSKAADAPILHEVVGLKEELERIREQVENLE